MWPDRRLTALLGIEHPIVQAPMLGSSTPALAAAVSAAGGVGSIACAAAPADELHALCAELRSRTAAPFNLNFFVMDAAAPDDPATLAETVRLLQPYYDALGLGPVPEPPPPPAGIAAGIVDALVDLRPPVVSFHFGAPGGDVLRRLKAAGVVVISSATTVAEARALAAAGVDVIIAQGWEAGGHRGSHAPTAPGDGVGTLALVPQIADAVDLPVIAAGGVADGRGIAAAFALGASGVQIGTGFLGCPEAATDPHRRALLRNATNEDTMVTAAISGRAARVVRSRYAAEMAEHGGRLAAFPTLLALTAPLRAAGLDDPISFHLYGQAAALTLELPAGELMARLVSGAAAAFERLSRAGQ